MVSGLSRWEMEMSTALVQVSQALNISGDFRQKERSKSERDSLEIVGGQAEDVPNLHILAVFLKITF